MNTKDFFDENYKVKPLEVLDDETLINLLDDPKYAPIMRILREKPFTFKEIHKRYNAGRKKPKEEVTIRQYIKVLEDSGMVVKAGQSITEGKIAAENLYGRSARFYFPVVLSEDFWESEENQFITEKVLQILQYVDTKKKPTIESLRKLLYSIYSKTEQEIAQVFEKFENEIAENLSNSTFNEIRSISNFMMLLVLLTNSSIYKKDLEDNFY